MNTTLKAPVSGKVVLLENVSDPVFARKMLGDGVAVAPTNDVIVSPVKGKITMLAETKHAIGIMTDTGVEILIHIGIDTVNLKGEGFEKLANVDDEIEVGTPLVKFDPQLLKDRGIESTTMVLITNTAKWTAIESQNADTQVVSTKDNILVIA